MSGGQRQAPKKPWELRYVLLSNTTPRWTQPVSVYLLERIGSSGKVWLVCRPALDPEQETEPRFQLPGATEDDEYICFERVDFSTLRAGDDFPLGQPGPMPDAIMFDHISAREESPYTRANLLAVCPRELRATARFALTPDGGRARLGSDAGSPRGGGGNRPARGQDARPSGSDGGGSNAATEERLDAILHAITTQNQRLEALEQGRRAALAGRPAAAAKTVTGTFDDAHLAELSAADRALINELKNARPSEVFTPSAVEAAAASDSAPALPVDKMLMRATLALEQVAGRNTAPFGQQSHSTVPKFKLTGAQGRVQQDALNKAFNEDPAAVVREFEAAVASLAALDPSEQLTGHIIQETWRNNVPAKEHAQIVRTSEAVLDAYLALRQGNVARGMARLALLLAAMEQSVLDEGKWNLRAGTLLGMPPAPVHNYRTATAEQKPSGSNKLGPLAQFCSADRSTTALAVYRDNNPSTSQ